MARQCRARSFPSLSLRCPQFNTRGRCVISRDLLKDAQNSARDLGHLREIAREAVPGGKAPRGKSASADLSQLLGAVWDGPESRGEGGTAAIVDYGRTNERIAIVI